LSSIFTLFTLISLFFLHNQDRAPRNSQQVQMDRLSVTMRHPIPELKRSNSSPAPSPFLEGVVLVKVIFPSLECTKMLRLDAKSVSYDPLVKILTIAKVDDEDKKTFRLYTIDGIQISNGDAINNLKEKDTLIFKRKDDPLKISGLLNKEAFGKELESKLITLYPPPPPPPSQHAPPLSHSQSLSNVSNANNVNNVSGSDYWSSVSAFIGGFLKRRPTMNELPKHVFDMLSAPIGLRSYVMITCVSYLREHEAHLAEGIFRLSGLATEIRTVCESFKSESFDLEWVKNPHTVATSLKQYCRYVSPPIVPASVCLPWVKLMRSSATEEQILASVVAGLATLPPENRFVLFKLLEFMKLVLDNQAVNKMASHNLAVVWGPNLIQFQLPNLDAFSEANIQATLMNLIVSHIDDLKLCDL